MKLPNLNAAVACEIYPELSRTGTNYMWVRMMAQVNLARSSLFRDQRNFAIQFSLEICTANFISNSRNLEVGISLSSVTWSSFLQLTHKKGFCAGVNTYLLSHQSVLIVTTYFIPLHNCVLLSCRNRERLPFWALWYFLIDLYRPLAMFGINKNWIKIIRFLAFWLAERSRARNLQPSSELIT